MMGHALGRANIDDDIAGIRVRHKMIPVGFAAHYSCPHYAMPTSSTRPAKGKLGADTIKQDPV